MYINLGSHKRALKNGVQMQKFKYILIGLNIASFSILLPSAGGQAPLVKLATASTAAAAGAGAAYQAQNDSRLNRALLQIPQESRKRWNETINRRIENGHKPQFKVWHTPKFGFVPPVHCAAWSHDGESFITGSSLEACIWDRNGKLKHSLAHPVNADKVAWTLDDRSVATTSSIDQSVYVWDAQTGTKKRTFTHPQTVSNVQWSRDNKWLLTFADNLYIWRVSPAEHKLTAEVNNGSKSLALISPDGASIAIGAKNDIVKVYDLESGALKAELKHPWPVKRIAWSPNSKSLCTSCIGNGADFLYHWSMNPVAFKDYIANNQYVYSIAWDNDGNPKAIPARIPAPLDQRFSQQISGGSNARLIWSPDRQRAITTHETCACVWNTEHLRDPQFNHQYHLLETDNLDPAQTMLLILFGMHCNAIHETMNSNQTPFPRPILQTVVKKAQERNGIEGLTVRECADVLRTFHPVLMQMIINAYDIQDAAQALGIAEYKQAKEALFDNNAPILNDGTGKAEGPIQNALREYLMGLIPQKTAVEVEDDYQTSIDKRFAAAIQLAQHNEQTKAQATKALFAGINNCDVQEVRKNLNTVTVVARHPGLHHRTPLMEVIWKSEKTYADYDAIFNVLLTFKKYYNFDRYNYEERTSQLDAQDMEGNTPLMIAIIKNRFDYALRIAKRMEEADMPFEERKLYKAFAFTNNISKKTALNLMQDQKDKCAGNEQFNQLYSLLEKHDKIVI
jgi:WD40 repeat protein